MSLLVPVARSGITRTHIPGRIAYYIALASCTQEHPVHRQPLSCVQHRAQRATARGANALLLIGDRAGRMQDDTLITILATLGTILPTGFASGSDNIERARHIAERAGLRWLLTGSTPAPRHFYTCEPQYTFDKEGNYISGTLTLIDHTHLVQQKGK